MSIFNQRLNKILNEWTEPAIDHHLDNGVGAHSYAELFEHIARQYGEETTQINARIQAYLQHVGFQRGGGDREAPEQQTLVLFQHMGITLNRLAVSLRKISKRLSEQKDAIYSLYTLRTSTDRINRDVGGLYRTLGDIRDQMVKVGLRPDPQIFTDIRQMLKGLNDEIRKVDNHFSHGVENQIPPQPQPLDDNYGHDFEPAEEAARLLETDEGEWIPMMSPTDMQGIVMEHPDHGAHEALVKISKIMSYGPERSGPGETLRLIAQHWPLTKQEILDRVNEFYTPEMIRQVADWLDANGADYGIK